jgi:hypothetical protein
MRTRLLVAFVLCGLALSASAAQRIPFSGRTAEQLAAAGVQPVSMGAPQGMKPIDWAGDKASSQNQLIVPAHTAGYAGSSAWLISGRKWGDGVLLPLDVEPMMIYQVRVRARVLNGWLHCYVGGTQLGDGKDLKGETGVMRGHGWQTYTFEFTTAPEQRKVYLALTNWQVGTFLLDWVEYAPLERISTPANPAGFSIAPVFDPKPVTVGAKTVWVFDEPDFPERSTADAAFWHKALTAAGHRVSLAGVQQICTLDTKRPARVDVLVFPNRGYFPADCEPAVTSFMANGGAVIVGGSFRTEGFDTRKVSAETLQKFYRGEVSPSAVRVPSGKWLRKTADGQWATPWRLYDRQIFPYVYEGFHLTLTDVAYIPPFTIPANTTLVRADWLSAFDLTLPDSIVAPHTVHGVVPLTYFGEMGRKFYPLKENRDNVYLSLYVPTTATDAVSAASDAFVLRYHSSQLPSGTLVHLGRLADLILGGEQAAAAAAGLVHLACQPQLPGERCPAYYAEMANLRAKVDNAAKLYSAADDYLRDHLAQRTASMPHLARLFRRLLLVTRIHEELRDRYPTALPPAVDALFRARGSNSSPKQVDAAWEYALRSKMHQLADAVSAECRPLAAKNSADRLRIPWSSSPLIFGGNNDGGGGYRHLDQLARASQELGFSWVGRSGSNEPWMDRIYQQYGVKNYIGMGHIQGWWNPVLYNMNDDVLQQVTAVARTYRDRPSIAAHGTSCELLPSEPKTPIVQQKFRVYVQERYGRIENLNRVWGTSYASWDAILPPEKPKATGTPDHAAWEEYTRWNQTLFEDFNRRMCQAIRAGDPGRPVITQFHEPVGGRTDSGLNKLRLHQYEDLDGSHENVESHDWLHLGLAPTPTCNEEWHGILWSRGDSLDNAYRCVERMGIEAAQGQVGWIVFPYTDARGFRGALFDELCHPYPGTWSFTYITRRLQRVGELAVRGNNPPARVAMLHSDTAFRHTSHLDEAYMQERAGWYTLLRAAGVPVKVLDETQVTPRALAQYDVLIVPSAVYLPRDTAQAIEAYVSAGGTAVFQTSGMPAYDAYGNTLKLFDGHLVSDRDAQRPGVPALMLGATAYKSWRYADRFAVPSAPPKSRPVLKYVSGETAMARFPWGRGTVVLNGCPAPLDLGEGWEHDALAFLPLLQSIGIDDSYRLFQMQSGTAFIWPRVLDGHTYLWFVAGDTPEMVALQELRISSAKRLRDVLTNETISPKNGVFRIGVPAPGIRVLKVE